MAEENKTEPSPRVYIRFPDNWASMTEAEKKTASLQMATEMQRALRPGLAKSDRPVTDRPDDGEDLAP